MAKYTKTNFKTFIKKNAGKLYIKNISHFDGMDDSIRSSEQKEYRPVEPCDMQHAQEHTFGIKGAWLVGGGRDYFSMRYDAGFHGFEVNNCCGSFVIAIKTEAANV